MIGFVKCGAIIGDVVSRSRYPPTNKKRTAIVPNIQFGIEMRGMRIRERRGVDGCRFALFIASINNSSSLSIIRHEQQHANSMTVIVLVDGSIR